MKILLLSIYWSIALPFCSGLWANIPQDCDELVAPLISSEKIVSCVGQPIVLKAMNCVGTVVWSNQKKGNTLTVYPEKTTTYQAHCIKDSCKSKASNEVTVTINIPSSPLIKASQTKVCFGESVVLTATGCAGEVIWSNGLTGQEMTIQPIYSTKYTATCRNEGCVSCFADDIIITVVGGEPLSLTANKTILCKGESSILSAKGNCAGQIRWSNGAIAKTITVQPEHTTYYWAMCENTNCEPVKVVSPFK
ncbi:MAG: hypothetical protein R2822_03795 [Spirosomataceae bacterium]